MNIYQHLTTTALHFTSLHLSSSIMDGNYDPNRFTNMSGYNYNSSSAFGSSYSSGMISGDTNQSNFQVSEYFELDDWMEEDQTFMPSGYSTAQSPQQELTEVLGHPGGSSSQQSNRDIGGNERKENREKVAFKTKSEVEILDDGFKWRKYGKKMVKNSPNPRNYYRCSIEGCPVKKRVERDKEDPRYVITTYEGIHNHQGPSQF